MSTGAFARMRSMTRRHCAAVRFVDSVTSSEWQYRHFCSYKSRGLALTTTRLKVSASMSVRHHHGRPRDVPNLECDSAERPQLVVCLEREVAHHAEHEP